MPPLSNLKMKVKIVLLYGNFHEKVDMMQLEDFESKKFTIKYVSYKNSFIYSFK
jgi:hypothetical protein